MPRPFEWPNEKELSEEEIRDRLTENADLIKRDADLIMIKDELLQDRIITTEEYNILKVLRRKERHNYLLECLKRRPAKSFLPFCEVLKKKNYYHVANALLDNFERPPTSGEFSYSDGIVCFWLKKQNRNKTFN